MLKKSLISLFAAVAAFFLAACNTVEGVGKDLQKGGEAIEKAATKK